MPEGRRSRAPGPGAGRRCLCLALLVAVLLAPSPQGMPRGHAAAPPATVVIVATAHFITDWPPAYGPTHLRALLEKIRPDLLAVEAPANAPDPWAYAPYELARVTRPWARARGIPVHPVGWLAPRYREDTAAMFEAVEKAGKTSTYLAVEALFQGRSRARKVSCRAMNSEGGIGLWRDYHAGLHDLLGRDTPWEAWNARIVRNVAALCRKHPGKRIAVVFGGAHVYYLRDHLAREGGVRIVPASRFFPLGREALKRNVRPADYLLALRLLNFGAVTPEALRRLGRILEKVETFPDLRWDYHLFAGKYRLHRKEHEAALAAFRAAERAPEGTVSAFDEVTHLREAARVYVAIALGRLGRGAEARRTLQAVLDSPGLSEATRRWVAQVQPTLPR